jgi:single-strand DNA-binding protein
MAGLCKAMIIGNLGRDPEMRYTPTGKPVTSFSVAVSRVYNSAEGERKEETEWFRVSAWNKLAETCSQYLRKGSKVYVEGRLRTRTWEGQDGQKRLDLEIVASEMLMLDTKPRAEGADAGLDTKARAEGADAGMEEHGGSDLDQIPF